MFTQIKKTIKAEEGSVLPIFALSAVAMMTLAGMTLDVSRQHQSEQYAQNALDASALAIASDITNLTNAELDSLADTSSSDASEIMQTLETNAENYFTANKSKLKPEDVNFSVEITPISSRKFQVRTQAKGKTPTTFMKIAHKDNLYWQREAVSIVDVPEIEIAVAADISYSMTNYDMTALRSSLNSLIDTIYANNKPNPRRVISLIPFADSVNFGDNYKSKWLHQTRPGVYAADAYAEDFVGCFRPEYNSDTQRIEFGIVQPGAYAAMKPSAEGGVPFCPRAASKVEMFSSDPVLLKNRSAKLNKGYGTGTGIGVMWALRALSPSWRGKFVESDQYPRDFPPEEAADTEEKHLIILTDGRPIQIDYEGDGKENNSLAELKPLKIAIGENSFLDACAEIKKATGTIHVHTIGYRLDPTKSDQKKLIDQLADCTNGKGEAYVASIDSLNGVFETIGKTITRVRLTH